MTPEAQRIAIAKACGWTLCHATAGLPCGVPPGFIHEENSMQLPAYTSDLNAMHEAEKVLTEKQFSQYPVLLAKVIAGTQNKSRASGTRLFCGQRFLISSTAAQRAEAFLRTLGLWKEDA